MGWFAICLTVFSCFAAFKYVIQSWDFLEIFVFSIGFLYVTTHTAWYENNNIKDAKEFLVFQSPNNMANDINKYNISTCISLKP